MSIEKFKLNEKHIKLIRQLNITDRSGLPTIDTKNLFGNSDIYEDVDLILNGKTRDVKPDSEWGEDYSPEQKSDWDKIIQELSTAMNIVLFMGNFEPGEYVRRTYEKNWTKKIS